MASAFKVRLDNVLFDLYLEQKLPVHILMKGLQYVHACVAFCFWPGVLYIEKLKKGHYIVLSATDVYNMIVYLAN